MPKRNQKHPVADIIAHCISVQWLLKTHLKVLKLNLFHFLWVRWTLLVVLKRTGLPKPFPLLWGSGMKTVREMLSVGSWTETESYGMLAMGLPRNSSLLPLMLLRLWARSQSWTGSSLAWPSMSLLPICSSWTCQWASWKKLHPRAHSED